MTVLYSIVLVLFTSVYGLQLVACFSKVRGVLVDVFWAIVYLRPFRRHYYKFNVFSCVS